MLSVVASRPERQRLSEVPDFDLAPGEHQDVGGSDGGAEALVHGCAFGLGNSVH